MFFIIWFWSLQCPEMQLQCKWIFTIYILSMFCCYELVQRWWCEKGFHCEDKRKTWLKSFSDNKKGGSDGLLRFIPKLRRVLPTEMSCPTSIREIKNRYWWDQQPIFSERRTLKFSRKAWWITCFERSCVQSPTKIVSLELIEIYWNELWRHTGLQDELLITNVMPVVWNRNVSKLCHWVLKATKTMRLTTFGLYRLIINAKISFRFVRPDYVVRKRKNMDASIRVHWYEACNNGDFLEGSYNQSYFPCDTSSRSWKSGRG